MIKNKIGKFIIFTKFNYLSIFQFLLFFLFNNKNELSKVILKFIISLKLDIYKYVTTKTKNKYMDK